MPGRLERHRLVILVSFSLLFFLATGVRARMKPFWHDEIYTLIEAKFPLQTLWRAQRDGLDLAPPLNTILTRAVHSVIGEGRVTSRLLPMTAFWIASVLLFVAVSRRSNVIAGLAAAILPCYTSAYHYSYEARGYALTLGLFAVAFFAWSEAASGRRRWIYLPLLAVALGAGVWAHYFAVLAFVPIVLGELVREVRRRTVDWPMWCAVVAGGLLVAPLLPLAMAGQSHAGTFWAKTAGAGIAATYGFLFLPVTEWGSIGSLGFAAAVICIALIAGEFVARSRRAGPAAERSIRPFPAHEIVAAVATVALPIAGWLIGRVIQTGAAPRYLLFTVVGAAAVVPLGVWRMSRSRVLVAMLMVALVIGWAGQSLVDTRMLSRGVFRDPVQERPLLGRELAQPEPVIVPNGIVFLQFWYYSPPAWRSRITYLADPAAALAYGGSDTIDRNLLALKRWAPIGVREYDEFTASVREFPVYSFGAGWLLDRLKQSGASVEERGREPGGVVYRVRLDR